MQKKSYKEQKWIFQIFIYVSIGISWYISVNAPLNLGESKILGKYLIKVANYIFLKIIGNT